MPRFSRMITSGEVVVALYYQQKQLQDIQSALANVSGQAVTIIDIGANTTGDSSQLNTLQYNNDGDVFIVNSLGNIIPVGSSADSLTANVLNFGAIGDGVTDDSSAIAAAIATGLPVEVPVGNYLVSAELTLNDGQQMYGYGRNSNIVTATNGVTTNPALAYDMLTLGSNCFVESLRFSGNGEINFTGNWTSQNGIRIVGSYNRVSNCEFYNLRGSGMFLCHPSLTNIHDNRISGCKFLDCTIGYNNQEGSEYNSFDNSTMYGCSINMREVGANNSYANLNSTYAAANNALGLQLVANGGNSDNSTFVGCTFNHNNLINITGMKRGTQFTGCHFWTTAMTVSESVGVVFNSCSFGSATTLAVTATTAKVTLITSCVFTSPFAPTVSGTSAVITQGNNITP